MMLENQYTKDEIFERYLNTVFFGNNAYGVQAAAEVYFGKTVDQLTFVEAAYLAGLVRSPSGYDPIDNPERSRARFAQVVDLLVDSGEMTEAEGQATLDTFEVPGARPVAPCRPARTAADVLHRGAARLPAQPHQHPRLDVRAARGGVVPRRTGDPHDADPGLPAAGRGGPRHPPRDAAGLRRGDRLARLGDRVPSWRWSAAVASCPARTRSTWPSPPGRPASIKKLFILAAALQAGASPEDIIDGTRPCILPNPGDPSEPFEITDAVSRAPDTLRAMTWYSINCAYARLSQIVGLNRVVRMTYAMAQSPYLYEGQPETDRAPLQPFATYATGANEMSPLDMASGCRRSPTRACTGSRTTCRHRRLARRAVYTHDDPGVQVLDRRRRPAGHRRAPGRADQRHRPPLAAQHPAAGKTGTQATTPTPGSSASRRS